MFVWQKEIHFGIEHIKHDDRLVSFYTGFSSYVKLLAFFRFLGPAVNKLQSWGTKTDPRKKRSLTKLTLIDQLLMTLFKLKLNMMVMDLAFHFGVSAAGVLRYVTTWICFMYQHLISPLYVGSISDVKLTWVSGFLIRLNNNPGISITADHGFTIKDLLEKIRAELNIPPFMEGRQQLPAKEVQKGRPITSVRIHVERAIGRIKAFTILKHTMPISLARISNQIVCVCAYLSSFKQVLLPQEGSSSLEGDVDVENYFEGLSDADSSGDENDHWLLLCIIILTSQSDRTTLCTPRCYDGSISIILTYFCKMYV